MRTLAASRAASRDLQRAQAALEQQVGSRTRELGLLNSIAAVVSGKVDAADVLSLSLHKTMEAFGVEAGGAYELRDDFFHLRAHVGLSDALSRPSSASRARWPLPGKTLNLEQPLTWPLTEYPPGSFHDALVAEKLKVVIVVPLVAKGAVLGVLVLNTREGRALGSEEQALLIAVGQQIGLAMENALLLEAERSGRADAERRREVAEGLRETLAVLNSHQPLPEILAFIVRQACRLMGSDAGSLLQSDAACCRYSMSASCGLSHDIAASALSSEGMGGAAAAIEARRPLAVPNLEDLSRHHRAFLTFEPASDREHRELLLARGFRATLSVPLIVRGDVFGAITLYYGSPRQFSAEEVRLATALADQAALAVENNRLHEEAERAAALAERNRLARELHDSVTQSLYSITLYAEAVARLLDAGKSDSAAEHLRDLGTTAREALREMRLLIFELNPPALEKGNLVDALQIRLDAVEARAGVSVDLHVEGSDNLLAAVRQELYQICQEALNNVIKHSHAQAVHVSVKFQEHGVRAFHHRRRGGILGRSSAQGRRSGVAGDAREG